MPKLKTKKSVAKRFKLTKSGKIKKHSAFKSHLLSSKTKKRKRQLRHSGLLASADQNRMKILLPYGN